MLVKTVTCKLRTTTETQAALDATMKVFNEACNALSEIAWQAQTFKQFDLHRLGYHVIRERFDLPSQLTVRAIAKVSDSYKVDRTVQHIFGLRSAVVYDARCFKLHGVSSASLTTAHGRFSFSLAHGGKQCEQLKAGATGEADLLYRDGAYYLAITVKTPEPPAADMSAGIIGCDMGIVEILTDSTGESHSGEKVKAVRKRVRTHRRNLQKARTRSAYKRLQQVRQKVSRFTRDVNHCISKHIVQKALSTQKALAIEDLTGIRDRANGWSRDMRWQLGNWAFADLAAKICYKAAEVGLSVFKVGARNTSRTCSDCGYCDKLNRKSQAHFKCLQCGFETNADYNASVNIEARAKMSSSLMFRPALAGRGTSPAF